MALTLFSALTVIPVALAAAPGKPSAPAKSAPAKKAPTARKPATAAKKPAASKPAAPAAAKPAAAVKPALAGNATDDEKLRFFTAEVKPVLEAKCIACHSGEKPQGGLKLTSRAAILKGGVSGPSATLDNPRQSLLVKAVHFEGRRMPPQGKLPPKQIEALTRWVELGMPWPEGAGASLEPEQEVHAPPQVTPETMKFWSFQPVRRPKLPAVKSQAWVKNPIDTFVLAKLEKAGLKPNPPASRATLIRRAYYDLIGLPPSPEEVERFVNDRSPDAWSKTIDRLLASPQYGERWGRHWLDLVRYAESNSYERDGTKPYAWRYRDYVIQSFNQDKPYDQFVLEQLAGDELPERTPERLIATGYYRLGIWDDEPADPLQALYDDLDDIVSTTSQVFLGLTVGCARCHDHKIDPMPQKDYYKLLAFFSGVRRYGVRSHESVVEASLRTISSEEEQQRYRAAMEAYNAEVEAKRKELEATESKIQSDLMPVEKEEWRNEFARLDIVKKRVPKLVPQEEFDRYAQLTGEYRRLRRDRPRGLEMALAVTEEKPRPTHVLLRGNPHVPGDPVEPGFPAVLAPPQPQIQSAHADTSGRRLALAKWIVSPQNPLASRVMANRVWQYHFGRGIVRSTSDFGFQGDKPTHPELLDWLASELMSGGWKLKPLHKLIMTSASYQMSSAANETALKKDPDNHLFWSFPMRRLAAEEVRDSILAVNGSLNLKMGGPSFYPDIPEEVLAGQSRPGENWGKSSAEEQRRRSIYIFVKRSLVTPIIASFDGADTDFTCPSRFATTQPTQALGMLNSAWTNEQARVFAQFLKKEAGDNLQSQVRLALTRTLQRQPAPAEVERGVELVQSLQTDDKLSADEALASFCVVALNLNEFIYLD